MSFAFGNDPAKIDRYVAFWNRDDVKRPLVGFSFVGWFPFKEFAPCRAWSASRYLTPDMMTPQAFMEDYLRMLREGETLDDDLIRGACPMQVAVPFMPGILGCKLRILPDNVIGEERHLSWDEALQRSSTIKTPGSQNIWNSARLWWRYPRGDFR